MAIEIRKLMPDYAEDYNIIEWFTIDSNCE